MSTVKCPNSGPSTHSKAVKWDFDENLVPSEVPQLEEEVSKNAHQLQVANRIHPVCFITDTSNVRLVLCPL